jgi:organic radical activating enzyme
LWWLSALRAKGVAVRDLGNVSQLFVSFQGEGPHAGRRQLFVRLGGCPLRCRYCDEPESLAPVAVCRILGPDGTRERPNPFTPAALAAEVDALAGSAPPLHAVAVTGGEPLLQAEFLVDWLDLHRGRHRVLLETAGVLPARLRRVLSGVAIVSLDVKLPSNTGERARWEEHEECLAAAVAAGTEVYVKMPVDEGTAPEEVERGARLVARVAPQVPLYVMPLSDPVTSRLTVGASTLIRLHAAAGRYHGDVRLGAQLHKVLGIL